MVEKEAIEKENVLIQAGRCAVTILPQFGGKIASIRIGDQELLQSPLAVYGPRSRTMSFDAGDASGWDECLPSVAACTVETEGGTARIPDHGDLWRVEWKDSGQWSVVSDQLAAGVGEGPVALRGECFSLPLRLERIVALTESPKGWELRLDYTVSNLGSSPTPWSWSAHPLFVAEAGDRILLPSSIKTVRVEGSGGGRLGKRGDLLTWPVATLPDGSRTDLSFAQGPESGIGDKLFAGPFSEEQNRCVLERPKAGVNLRVRFDPAATPYLGLWICYGGWPERPGAKQMCVALEPSTAPVDSLAQRGPWSRTLAAEESFSWPMIVEIETV
jgi:galactose mutarotase-like enzyme